MKPEKSITKIETYIGQQIQIVAYGASYLGTLQKVDNENDVLILTDGQNKVTLELSRVESFMPVEPPE